MTNLELVWWRQNPKKTEEAIEKTVAPSLTKAQVKKGFEPWQEKIHLNLFYQRRLEDKDLTVRKTGVSIKPLRYAAVKKAGPLVPQSDSVDYGDGVEAAVTESKSKSTGGRLIKLGDKKSKAQYIRRRCKLVAGKTILKAMKTQVPDKDGNMGKYKKDDFLDEFVSEGLVQLAFGTKRGTQVAFLMQLIHQQCHPTHDTELCDGTNAYNVANRVKIAEAILTASAKIRRQYRYFLMGHRIQGRVAAANSPLASSGVRASWEPVSACAYLPLP